MSREIIATK